MIYFDGNEMFDCKTGSIAIKPLVIACIGDHENVEGFKHISNIDLFCINQPIITYKASKDKIK